MSTPSVAILRPTIEIAIHGRGGQAAKTCGELLTYALYSEGYNPHGQPRYTADRMGAPVSYAIRFHQDRSPVYDRSWIKHPQYVLLFDLTLLLQLDLTSTWDPGIQVIVNAKPEAPLPQELRPFSVAVIDANRIAKELGLMKGSVPILSSTMAGAFSRITGLVRLETLFTATNDLTKGALRRTLEPNLSALRRGYEEVKESFYYLAVGD